STGPPAENPLGSESDTGATSSDSSGTTSDSAADESGSTTGDAGEPDWVYPEPVWAVEAPAAHGMDADLLQSASEIAAAEDSGCLVVTRHGVIVHEWYAEGWDATTQTDVFSVTKSVTGTLVGLAQAEGLLHIDDFAADYIESWATTDAATVTIANLLQQDSGRHWDFFDDYVQLDAITGDKSAFAIERSQQHDPGQWWEYSNAGVQTLEPVLRAAVGGDVADWAQGALLDRIGMHATFQHDGAGNTVTYAHLEAGCRALARYGYLHLRRGRWAGGDQILPAQWVDDSTTPRTELNDAYGYLWWLNQPGHWVRPSLPDRNEGDGLLLHNAPLGAYTARGLRAQVVAVDPGTEIVFTRLAPVPIQDLFSSTEVEHELWAAIMAAVLE
ncbi:MAG: serine hydrolase, partial [Myxococcota bacterium]